MYDSFAFIDAPGDSQGLPRDRQMCIIVRPRTWLDKLWENCGRVLDQWLDSKDMQPYLDADYIVESHNEDVEGDVDMLIAEVRRLKRNQ